MKRLLALIVIAIFLFPPLAELAIAQTSYTIRNKPGQTDYHPEVWQQAHCIAEGGPKFAVIGHGTTPTADTSVAYTLPSFQELWLRICPDDSAAATGTDSIATYVVIQVRDTKRINTGMTYNGWRRIDSVAVAITDTLYGVWYEATKIPPATHIRTIVVATTDCDRGGLTSYMHWIVFKQ